MLVEERDGMDLSNGDVETHESTITHTTTTESADEVVTTIPIDSSELNGADGNAPINKPTATTPTLSQTAQDLTSVVLDFVSTANNETIGGCLVGLAAVTYLILGRVGLVLMGVLGGVVLHASWEGSVENEQEGSAVAAKSGRGRRKETGLDVIERVLDWRESKKSEKDQEAFTGKVKATKTVDFSGFKPKTAAALQGFVDAVIRDYVKYAVTDLLVLFDLLIDCFLDGGTTL
jgi:hypothetical protein